MMTKRTRAVLMLLLALIAGLAATLTAARWIHSKNGAGHRIVVVTSDVETGTRLAAASLELADWPRGSMPPGAFTDIAALQGRVTRMVLTRGEPVLEAKLAPAGSKGGLSAVVGEGRRAMTVRVNDVVGVAGFALPGNYVDIMVNTQSPGNQPHESKQDQAISKIVLERILVLAVAQESNRDETKPKVVNAVTLEVTPSQAEALDLARSVGTLSLVLRNQVDPQPASTAGATKESLLGLQVQPVSTAAAPPAPAPARRAPAPAPVHEAAPQRDCVEVIRGTVKYRECF